MWTCWTGLWGGGVPPPPGDQMEMTENITYPQPSDVGETREFKIPIHFGENSAVFHYITSLTSEYHNLIARID